MGDVKEFVLKNQKAYKILDDINFKYVSKNKRIINLDIDFIKVSEIMEHNKNSSFSLSRLTQKFYFSKSEEIKYLEEYTQTKDKKVIEKLLKLNIPFLISISKKYASMTGLDSEDLLSAGCEGLIKAIKVSETTKRNFSYTVKDYIRRYMLEDVLRSKGIKMGDYSYNCLSSFLRIKAKNMQIESNNQNITNQIIEDLIARKKIKNIEKQEIKNIIKLAQTSIFSEVNEEELISEDTSCDIAIDKVYNEELLENLLNSFCVLNEREKTILERKYGLFSSPQLQKQISQEMNLSESYIARTGRKALRKLRHPSRSKKLRDYLD